MRPEDPFDTLLHRYRGLLFSLCQRYQQRSAAFEDLMQEASVALWVHREMLYGISGPRQAALVWKIARNAMIDELRRTPVSEALQDDYDTVDDDHSQVQELRERIALLPEPDRTVVTMQLEGYSYEEIGAAMGLSVKSVSMRLVRLKDKIRKEWK